MRLLLLQSTSASIFHEGLQTASPNAACHDSDECTSFQPHQAEQNVNKLLTLPSWIHRRKIQCHQSKHHTMYTRMSTMQTSVLLSCTNRGHVLSDLTSLRKLTSRRSSNMHASWSKVHQGMAHAAGSKCPPWPYLDVADISIYVRTCCHAVNG